ncbi:hypothetical protein AtubIFM56815_004942 [Aspergillus tubingensis]|uniref:Protein kinase domain-containing protein n=1 Tax=Aspergillus tubingensis TaxID=5068 RepID=A0A9W6EIP0_ASPTU|nr:hypothetical protein AtubIFM56815_004942 [Aspergillus tubingensis]
MTLEGMKPAIRQLLVALDSLHSVTHHTYRLFRKFNPNKDLRLENLLLPAPSPEVLSDFEEQISSRPAPRKVLQDRTIYTSSPFPAGDGLPLLGDLGAARFAVEEQCDDIMPDYYRAPEVILKSNWDYKVDIWSVGMVAWDIVSPKTIIQGKIVDDTWDDGAQIAELVALLGPPSPEFVKNANMSWVFWDESGEWKDLVPIPDRSFEKLAADIQGEDVEGFLRWLRLALQWNPEDRPTAVELLMDPWLMKGLDLRKKS